MSTTSTPSPDATGAPEISHRHPLRRAAGAFLALLALAVVAVAVLTALIPLAVGGGAFTVLSGSMEPALHVGSVVVTRPIPPAAVGVGDVITFTDRDRATGKGRIVTHRVIAVEPGPVFRTQGDANKDADPHPVAAGDVHGVLLYSVPWVGSLREEIGTTHGLLLVAGLALLLAGGCVLTPRYRRPGERSAAQGRGTRRRPPDGRDGA